MNHQPRSQHQPPEEQYLWDGSGAPDATIADIERALAGRRFNASSTAPTQSHEAPRPNHTTANARFWLALAACLLLVVGALQLAGPRLPGATQSNPAGSLAWTVESLQGAPKVGNLALGERGKLLAGQWLTTGTGERASVSIAGIGRVTLEPNSRLGLVKSQSQEQRMELASGALHAFITAPPKLFVVDTPAGAAVDMGCAYDLSVDPDGSTLLRVATGWVELSGVKWSARVVAGYECRTAGNSGPQLPRRLNSPEAWIAAVDHVQNALLAGEAAGGLDAAVDAVLQEATTMDCNTLWHMIERTTGPTRQRIAVALSQLCRVPEGVTLEGIAAGDQTMLDIWWEESIRWS